jgi:hypothetical protein
MAQIDNNHEDTQKNEYTHWRKNVRFDQITITPHDELNDDGYDGNSLILQSTDPFHASTSSVPKRSRVTTFRQRMRGLDGGLMRLNDMQRQQVAERMARREMHNIFDWLESTYPFRILYHYAKQWRTGNDRRYGDYTRRMNQDDDYSIRNPYYYRSYNPNATYSRHESLIRSLVDRWIAFRDRISSQSQIDQREDTRMASDMADRLERYLFQQGRRRRMIYDAPQHARNRLWLLWKAFVQLTETFLRFILRTVATVTV